MSRRTALAFFLSLMVIIGYNYIVAQKYPPPERPTYNETGGFAREALREQAAREQKEVVLPSPISPQAQDQMPKSAFSVKGARPGKDFLVETDLMRLVITASGARVKSCQLKGYAEEKIDAKAIQGQIEGMDQSLAGAPPEARELLQREQNKLKVLLERLNQKPQMAELVSLAATVDTDFSPAILLPEAEDQTLKLNTALYRCAKDGLALNRDAPDGRLEFTYTDSQGRSIKKVYSFSNSNYGIGLDIIFSGWQKQDLPAGHFLLFYGPGLGMPQAQRGRRTFGYKGPLSCFQTGERAWTQKEKYAREEKNIFVRREHKDKGRILWSGLENKYFLAALIPGALAAEAVIIEKSRFGEQKVALAVPWKGSGPSYNFKLYLGPKKEEQLRQVGATLDKAIDYGFFSPIARFIYQILVFFSRWTHNFGWAIILLCLVVKIVFYPLTHHSFEGMQKMQEEMKSIQPEMNALRERLKDNPQKLNKEIMELYRKRGVNPLASCQSGCLPLILQMPVFFALYGVLYNSIELRGAPFLGWVTDLSAKDPYYVLPILMGISMFAQQKLTGMGAAGGAQQEQAKMMGMLMPVFLTWIFASLPSGVVLYWLTFNIVTSLQQLLIKRKRAAVATA